MLVVTLSHQRSGTKFLSSMFLAGTQISTLGEIFNPDNDDAQQFHRFVGFHGYNSLVKQPSDRVLDNYFSSLRTELPIKHFDLMFNQFEMPCLGWNPFPERFVYGYLKSRKALVILLEREPQKVFRSIQMLNAGGAAHTVNGSPTNAPSNNPPASSVTMSDVNKSIGTHREEIVSAFADYPYIVQASYADLSRTCAVPDAAVESIASCAMEHGLPFHRDLAWGRSGMSHAVPGKHGE
jgi:hypothetical protein